MRVRTVFAGSAAYLLLAVFITGCQKKVAVAPPPPSSAPREVVPPPPPNAPTASLVAEPRAIERGQTATLRWSATDATELTISGLGAVEPEGTREVRPAESTMYILRAEGPGGSASASVAVHVNPPSPSPPVVAKSFAERVDTELIDAYFDYDMSNIREDAGAALMRDADALRSILADFPEAIVYLEGHCDERGSAEYNLALGDRRTASAGAFLEVLGVPTDRVKRVSFGKERPRCADTAEDCWQKNRRVHFSADENERGQSQVSTAGGSE